VVEKGTEMQTTVIENLSHEIFSTKLPNIGKDMDLQIQEAFKTSNRHDQKKNYACHIIVKNAKSIKHRKNIEICKKITPKENFSELQNYS
jgi:hypothetical protein